MVRQVALVLIIPVVFFACSDDGGAGHDSAPQDGAADVAGPQPDGGATPLPGCPAGCAADEVCLGGACTPTGPSKACGGGKYGANLPASGVVYVDSAHGGASSGSESEPYKTIGAALAALTPSDTVVAVAAGTYTEDLTIETSVELRCRCPSQVTVAGKVEITPPVGNSDLTVVIDGCRISPAGTPDTPTSWGSCSGDADPKGIYAHSINHAISLLVQDSVVAGWCTGIYFNVAAFLPTTALCVARSRILANVKGIDVVETPTVSSTPWTSACKGIQEPMAVELSQVEENRDYGVHTRTGAQSVALKGNVVRSTGRVGSTGGGLGFGIYLGNTETGRVSSNRVVGNLNRGLGMVNLTALVASDITIEGNALIANRGAGIQLEDLQASKTVVIRDNLVKDTVALAGTPGGDGIQVAKLKGTSFDVDVSDNTVDRSERHGVLLDGVGGAVDNNTITNSGGYGLVLQQSSATVGSNSFSGNASGEKVTHTTTVELCGSLPIPIP